jgi:hypothetical protein
VSAFFAQQKKRLLCAVMRELKGFKSIGFSAVGTAEQLKDFSQKTKRKWTLGIVLNSQLE